MARADALLAQRWGFLDPWLELLDRRVKYKQVAQEEQVWEAEKRVLEVTLPCQSNLKYERYSRAQVNYELREVREALALVAAVAHVDQKAWKFVLNKIWGLKLGNKGSEEMERDISPRFVLIFDSMAGIMPMDEKNSALKELIFFCGTSQRKNPTPEFLTGLRDIAVRAGQKILPGDKPGMDITIPVQVGFAGGYMASRQFMSIMKAEQIIKEDWEQYDQHSSGNQTLPSRSLRCTFELAPMIVEMKDSLASKLQKYVSENVWFSQLTLPIGGGWAYDGVHAMREETRQMMTAVFDSIRRSPRRASTRFYQDRRTYFRDGSPLQVNEVNFSSYTGLMLEDLAAMMSALVVNQTTKQISIRAEKRTITGGAQWKWIAYGLFSKRARAYSALESFSLNQVDSLDDFDMEGFSAVLASEHPEEVLCGSASGVVSERNATLISGAKIRWRFQRGQPVVDEKVIETKTSIRCLRTFSDDGDSEWVNAMIPGLGRCQVQRDDLLFELSSSIESRQGALKTLTIGFNREEHTDPRSNGLPQFLALVGSTLKSLTLDGPRDSIDENLILRHCPNLHTLSLCGGIVDVQLDLSEYRYNGKPIPELSCHWHDVRALAADLGDVNNPLSKIVRRLRLRLNDRCKGWKRVSGGYDFDKLPDDMKALVRMLEVNQHLAYLDVLLLTDHRRYGNPLKKKHLKPINLPAKLPQITKLAFLSVVASRQEALADRSNKRSRRSSQDGALVGGLDQRVLSTIFSFAGPPLLRQVYLRTTKHYWEPYSDQEFYSDDDEDHDDGEW